MCKYKTSNQRYLLLLIDEDGKCLAWQELRHSTSIEDRERITKHLIASFVDGNKLYPMNKKVMVEECCCPYNFDHFTDMAKMGGVTEISDETRHNVLRPGIVDGCLNKMKTGEVTSFTRAECLKDKVVRDNITLIDSIGVDINKLDKMFDKKIKSSLLKDTKKERDRIIKERNEHKK